MAQWVKDAALLTAVAWVTAVVHIRSVAWELPHAMGTTKRKRGKEKKKKKGKPYSTPGQHCFGHLLRLEKGLKTFSGRVEVGAQVRPWAAELRAPRLTAFPTLLLRRGAGSAAERTGCAQGAQCPGPRPAEQPR